MSDPPPRRSRSNVETLFRNIPKSLKSFFGRSSDKNSSAKETQRSSSVRVNPIAPAEIDVAGDKLRLALQPSPDGDMLELERRPQRDESAAVRIQAAFRRYKARALFESLQTLDKMNLELKWPDAIPFIGLLIVKVHSIHNLTGVRTAVLRAKFDDDTSSSIPGAKNKMHVIHFDQRATFVNVALRSNSILTIEVLQGFELAVRIVGRVHMPLSTIQQGVRDLDLDIRSVANEVVGCMKMTVGYQWLRGSSDYGGYNEPAILVMPSRKMRGPQPAHAVERLWKVNHWVCSHDNVWPASPDFADVVKLAMRNERNRTTSIAFYSEDGKPHGSEVLPSTIRFEEALGRTDLPALTSTELLTRTTGQIDWSNLPSIASQSSVSTDPGTAFEDFGSENWRNALDEILHSQRSEGATSSAIEEEVNFNYNDISEELQAEAESDVSDSESSASDASPQSVTAEQPTEYRCIIHRITKLCKDKATKRERPTVPCVTGKFEYGVYRPAKKRGVHVFVRKVFNASEAGYASLNTYYLGEHRTSRGGNLQFPAPRSITCQPGHYNVMAMLPDDNTFGHGSMFLLEKGTKCVIFDLDGTVTTSDAHVVAQTILESISVTTVIGASIGRNYDIRARPNALMCVRAWAAKGYQVIYLSGRQGSAYNMTQQWLAKHGYPPGPIHLTRTHLPTLPVYASVGHFKIKYMEELKNKGLELYAAYGNTGTDIKAYEKVGIPKDRTFIVGPNGGKRNTEAVKDFTTHLPKILTFPDSDKPLPYTELLRAAPVQPSDGL